MNNQKEKVSEHYRNLEIEPFKIIEKNFTPEEQRGYYKGNILKYTLRDKGQNQEDAVKIQVYAEKLQDLELKVKNDETQKQLERGNEICLLKDLVDFLVADIQRRQKMIETTDNANVKDAIQYYIWGLNTALYEIEALKERSSKRKY